MSLRPLVDYIFLPSIYSNETTQVPEAQTGLAGASNVLLNAWSPSLLQVVVLSVDASGNLMVTGGGGGGGGTSSTFGASFPSAGTAAGFIGSTGAMAGANLDAGGNLLVSSRTQVSANAPSSASVGVASGVALAANTARKGLTVVNTSTNTVSLALGSIAILGSGITLSPFGVYWMDEYSLSGAALNAIASAAGSNISIQEYQ